MMGTRTPNRSSVSTILGTAAVACPVLTVPRTSSEPARASAIAWFTVEATSAVSVLVMDCTTIGCAPPTFTPPASTTTAWRRGLTAIDSLRVETSILPFQPPHPGCRVVDQREACHETHPRTIAAVVRRAGRHCAVRFALRCHARNRPPRGPRRLVPRRRGRPGALQQRRHRDEGLPDRGGC